MSWLGRAIGDFGSQVGEGYGISQDWKQRQQQMALEVARQKIAEFNAQLQNQELQQRMRQAGLPRFEGTTPTEGGGMGAVMMSPTGELSVTPLAGTQSTAKRPSLKEQFESEKDPAKKKQILADLTAEAEAIGGVKRDPIKQLQKEAAEAFNDGDMETFQAKQKEIQQLSSAAKSAQPTELNLIMRSQQGDQAATTALRELQARRSALVRERGLAFGLGKLQVIYDPESQQVSNMLGYDVLAAQRAGKQLIPAGRLPDNVLIAAQRLVSESVPAIANVRQNIKAFDNKKDQAIFARIMAENPIQEGMDPHTWLGTVLSRALTADLSPEGKQLVIADRRLNETVSTLRATLGLPATNSATSLTLQLLPGPTTPNSAFATEQLNQLQQIIKQSVEIPILGGGARPTPPPGFTLENQP